MEWHKQEKGERTERLVDGQVGLDGKHGSAHDPVLFEHVTSPPVQHSVDASHSIFWRLWGVVFVIA